MPWHYLWLVLHQQMIGRITMGGQEDIAYENCKAMRERFDQIGIKHSYYETPGGHTWPVWRESLYFFAQKLFK